MPLSVKNSDAAVKYSYLVFTSYSRARAASSKSGKSYLIQNSQAVKKSAALRKAMVKKDVKSKVAAKKWL